MRWRGKSKPVLHCSSNGPILSESLDYHGGEGHSIVYYDIRSRSKIRSLIRINVVNYLRSPNQLFPFKTVIYFWDITVFVYEKKHRKKNNLSKIQFFFCKFSRLYRENLTILRHCAILFYELNCCEVDRNMKKRPSQKIELTTIIRYSRHSLGPRVYTI